jgi:hypothetical protein
MIVIIIYTYKEEKLHLKRNYEQSTT